MEIRRRILYLLLIIVANNSHAQSDTVQYLFMGHPRYDDRAHEYVLPTVEKLDYSKYELLLLGGDLTWNTSELTSTLEYCNTIFHLSDTNTHLAMGNHDRDNITALLSYTQKERFYAFSRNNITFIVLDTEYSTPNISGEQLDMIKAVADSIENSDYLVVIHHRILWMADNPDLVYLMDSVAASTKGLSSSNFFTDVYPELQKVKAKGIPVFCLAGDRTDVNIEYAIEDSIQLLASGMVGTFPDSNNFVIVLTQIKPEKKLSYEFVPLTMMDTLAESPVKPTALKPQNELQLTVFPNPCKQFLNISCNQLKNTKLKAEIYSLDGKKISSENLTMNTSWKINIEGIKNGIYLLHVVAGSLIFNEKIYLVK